MARGFQKSYRYDMADWLMLRSTVEQLRDACEERFPAPAYEVRIDDDGNTVWVTRAEDGKAVGIHIGTAERRGIAAVLDATERKLAGAAGVQS